MTENVLAFEKPVTLAGGGYLDRTMLAEAMAFAPVLVAADGAADRVAGWGEMPEAVIGDMDSVADLDAWKRGPSRIVHLPEQDSTDFEKCLYSTEAPFYIGAGFTGHRMDHSLSAFNAMLARPAKTVVLVSECEAIALVPPGREIALTLEPGALVSLHPLRQVTGVRSSGLRWPIDHLRLAPGDQVSLSNRATEAEVTLRVDADGVLLFVERRFLATLVRAVAGGP